VRTAKTKLREFEQALINNGKEKFILRLYVSGMSNRSRKAIKNLQRICAEHLDGCYELEIIDLSKKPSLAESEQIVATPALVKKLPLPLRKLIGDMSDLDKVLLGIYFKLNKKRRP
jgi:circadian clock protein KaiB